MLMLVVYLFNFSLLFSVVVVIVHKYISSIFLNKKTIICIRAFVPNVIYYIHNVFMM